MRVKLFKYCQGLHDSLSNTYFEKTMFGKLFLSVQGDNKPLPVKSKLRTVSKNSSLTLILKKEIYFV